MKWILIGAFFLPVLAVSAEPASLGCPTGLFRQLSLAPAVSLKDRYLWDNWIVRDSESGLYHRYALSAPKTVSPEGRHGVAEIHYFRSPDGINWENRGPLFKGWSGTVAIVGKGKNKRFWLYYTGVDGDLNQVLRAAVSKDGENFSQLEEPILSPEPLFSYYHGDEDGPPKAWRDPSVFLDKASNTLHLYFAAKQQSQGGSIVPAIGHATGNPERPGEWELQAPIVVPGTMKQLEVPNVVKRGENYYLFASSTYRSSDEVSEQEGKGQWRAYRSRSPFGPFIPVNRKEGVILSFQKGIYAVNLVRDGESDLGPIQAAGFYPIGHPKELSLTPIFPVKIENEVPKALFP